MSRGCMTLTARHRWQHYLQQQQRTAAAAAVASTVVP